MTIALFSFVLLLFYIGTTFVLDTTLNNVQNFSNFLRFSKTSEFRL